MTIMLEAHLRPAYQQLFVEPVAKRLAGRCTPNAVSLASLLVGLAAAPAIAMENPWLAMALLLISGYLDTLDGSIARLTNHCTPFGTMLDITCDRLVEFAVIFGLFAYAPEARGWLCMGMLGSVLIVVTTFLTAGMFLPNESEKSFNYTPALMERPEAFTFFVLMIFFPAWFDWLAYLFIVLVLYTAMLRMLQTKRALSEQTK